MDAGLYNAASGMSAEMIRQDAIANDLANASTPGYKADRVSQQSFGQILLRNTMSGAQIGSMGAGVVVGEAVTDTSPQAIEETGDPMDFAIEGEGWFSVQGPAGQSFTRNGRFSLDAQGNLTTAQGYPVAGRNGPVRADADGKVDPADIQVVLVQNPTKAGDGLYTGGQGGAGEPGRVRSGALEGSGADPTRSMVDMIASMRAFEAGQRAITTLDETLGKAANDVGRIP